MSLHVINLRQSLSNPCFGVLWTLEAARIICFCCQLSILDLTEILFFWLRFVLTISQVLWPSILFCLNQRRCITAVERCLTHSYVLVGIMRVLRIFNLTVVIALWWLDIHIFVFSTCFFCWWIRWVCVVSFVSSSEADMFDFVCCLISWIF